MHSNIPDTGWLTQQMYTEHTLCARHSVGGSGSRVQGGLREFLGSGGGPGVPGAQESQQERDVPGGDGTGRMHFS